MSQQVRRRVARWLIPALLIIAWLGLGGWLGPLSGELSNVMTSGAASYLPRDAEAAEVMEIASAFGEPEALPAVVVYSREAALTAADEAAIAADLERVRAELSPHLAADPIGPEVSQDGRAARVVVLFAGTDETKITPHVQQLRELLQPADGRDVWVTGPAGVQADLQDALGHIDLTLLLVTGTVILIILVLVYRSPVLPLLVLAIAGTALGVAMGIIYLLAEPGWVSIGSEVQGILSVLVIGAATDYALLLIARYREELRRHADRVSAMAAALRGAVGPILASAATVALGLLCLLLSDLGLNRQLGPAAAIGIGCAVLAMLTLLPASLVLLGRAAFWPRRPSPDRAPERAGIWSVVAGQVARRPRLIWMGTAVVLAVASLGVMRLDADGLSATDMIIADGVESKVGQQELAAHYPAGDGGPVLVVARAEAIDAVVTAAAGVDNVAGAATYPPAAEPGQAAPAPMVVDGLARADVVLDVDPDSQAAVATVRDLRAALGQVPDADAMVGGVTAIRADFHQTAARDRAVVAPLLLVVVFVVLLVLLRSLVAPLLLLATVVVSFLAAIGVSAVVFQDILGFPGVDSTFPLHAFVFLVALGIDYNIFLISRVREEARRSGTRAGTRTGLTLTGGVITSAGVVLAATFAALGVVPLVLMVELAFTVAFGVLLDTLIVRSLLVPALFFEVGRWIWWPSRLTAVRDARMPVTPRPLEPALVTPRPGAAEAGTADDFA